MRLVNNDVAARALSENHYLRSRLCRLDQEDQKSEVMTDVSFGNTRTLNKLKKENEELHSSILELEAKLAELKHVNVTELYHKYLILDRRRSYLNNENISLRNILLNQKRDVKKVTDAINFCQEMRRLSDAENELLRSDIKILRDRRKSALEEIDKLSRKEKRLEEELQFLLTCNEEIESRIRKVIQDNIKKEQKIAQLTNDFESLERGSTTWEASRAEEDDLERLRNEFVYLKEQLKSTKR